MIADLPLLQGLRRSVLGAWLAVVYALALLASGLAPAPAWAQGFGDDAVMCSGLMPPGPDSQPADAQNHCKGCPATPVCGGPAQASSIAVVRLASIAGLRLASAEVDAPRAALGLPQSRAPPRSGVTHF